MKIYVVYKIDSDRWSDSYGSIIHMAAFKTREEALKGMRKLMPADMMCDNGYLIMECDLL